MSKIHPRTLITKGSLKSGLTIVVGPNGDNDDWVMEYIDELSPRQYQLVAKRLGGYGGRAYPRLDTDAVINGIHAFQTYGAANPERDIAQVVDRTRDSLRGLYSDGDIEQIMNLALELTRIEISDIQLLEAARRLKAEAARARYQERRRSPLVHLLVATA